MGKETLGVGLPFQPGPVQGVLGTGMSARSAVDLSCHGLFLWTHGRIPGILSAFLSWCPVLGVVPQQRWG